MLIGQSRFKQQSMGKKLKIFLAFLYIGLICVAYIPDNACDTVGSFCQYSPIVGYCAIAISGLIMLHEIYMKCKENCLCCEMFCYGFCQDCRQLLCFCCWSNERNSEPLLADSFIADQLLYNNQQNGPQIQQYPGLPDYWQQNSFSQPNFQNNEVEEAYRQSFNQKECTICLDQFNQDHLIDRKRCGHKFHAICIRDWLDKNQNCPICRLKLR